MRKLVLLLVLTAFFATTFAATAAEPQAPNGSKIEWQTSIDKVISQAKAQNKLILMDFFNPE